MALELASVTNKDLEPSPSVAMSPAEVEAELIELAASAGALADGALSDRTKSEYSKDWTYFNGWCEDRGFVALPAREEVLIAFVTFEADKLGRKPSTIARRLAGVRFVHREAGESWCGGDRLAKVLKGHKRKVADTAAENGHKVVKKAAPLTRDDLLLMLPHADSERLIDIRDRAVLLVGFAGFFRRSELEGLQMGNMSSHGVDCLRFHLPVAKTSQETGQDRDVCEGKSPVACPVRALRRWLEVAEITDGPVFRSITKGGNVRDGALSARSIDRIVRTRADEAGLQGSYSGHSMRAGAATEAKRAGFSMLEISRAGGWADDSRTVAGYVHDGESTGLRLL